MSTLEQLNARAAKRPCARAQACRTPAAFFPAEAFELLQLDPSTFVWSTSAPAPNLTGLDGPAIETAQYAHVEWIQYPGSVPNTAVYRTITRSRVA